MLVNHAHVPGMVLGLHMRDLIQFSLTPSS